MAASDHLRSLYADNEAHDGYFRDRCVFSPAIDIEDTMHATIEYENGAIANYLLTAYSPDEGYRAEFHGTRGKVTLETIERPRVNPDGSLVRPPLPEQSRIVVQPLFCQAYQLAMPNTEGLHGGGDRVMLEHLFRGGPDTVGLAADERAGAWSVLVGVAANMSLAQNQAVLLAELAAGIERPPLPTEPFGPALPWSIFDMTRYPFLADAETTGAAML